MFSVVTTSSACLRRQVVYLVCGCMLSMCVCVPDVQAEEVVTALSTKDDPLKLVKQL